jgi:hypothetical protein
MQSVAMVAAMTAPIEALAEIAGRLQLDAGDSSRNVEASLRCTLIGCRP